MKLNTKQEKRLSKRGFGPFLLQVFVSSSSTAVIRPLNSAQHYWV